MGSLEGKKAVVAELVEKFNASKTIVVVDYRGLTVAQATKLRKQLREAGVDYRVVKNTLLTIAAKEAGADALVPTFKGVTAIAFGGEDLIAPAQIIAKFSKENKILEIKRSVRRRISGSGWRDRSGRTATKRSIAGSGCFLLPGSNSENGLCAGRNPQIQRNCVRRCA